MVGEEEDCIIKEENDGIITRKFDCGDSKDVNINFYISSNNKMMIIMKYRQRINKMMMLEKLVKNQKV